VCTTCAPGDQEKSHHGQREYAYGRMSRNSIFEGRSPANANRARKSDICAIGTVAILKRVDRTQTRDPMKVTPPTAAFVLRTSSACIVNGVKRINQPVYEVINGLPLRD
jgi:hypothetical protein